MLHYLLSFVNVVSGDYCCDVCCSHCVAELCPVFARCVLSCNRASNKRQVLFVEVLSALRGTVDVQEAGLSKQDLVTTVFSNVCYSVCRSMKFGAFVANVDKPW